MRTSTGLTEPTAFNRYFKREVGMTPLEYKKQQIQ